MTKMLKICGIFLKTDFEKLERNHKFSMLKAVI